ncbi:MAG: rRNA maturation RNAse YbeY [Desulfovibrio sp.]|nr:rRNA maturation RNAse YbeY [Desulfovibrio sp.]
MPKPKSAQCVQIFVHYQAPWLMPCGLRQLQSQLKIMLKQAAQNPFGQKIKDLDLFLVNDAEIAWHNLMSMRCPGPTNILSFPGGQDLPGSLILSLDTLKRECLLYGQKLEVHFWRLLAHGLAHLAELDHGPEHQALEALCLKPFLSASENLSQAQETLSL